MENFYTAYTKTINGVTFYFVKQYETFPEYKNVPPSLKNYGMHTNFHKACKIAMIKDRTIQKQLLDTVKNTTNSAKLIRMNDSKGDIYNYRTWQINLPRLLSWRRMKKLLHFKKKIA